MYGQSRDGGSIRKIQIWLWERDTSSSPGRSDETRLGTNRNPSMLQWKRCAKSKSQGRDRSWVDDEERRVIEEGFEGGAERWCAAAEQEGSGVLEKGTARCDGHEASLRVQRGCR